MAATSEFEVTKVMVTELSGTFKWIIPNLKTWISNGVTPINSPIFEVASSLLGPTPKFQLKVSWGNDLLSENADLFQNHGDFDGQDKILFSLKNCGAETTNILNLVPTVPFLPDPFSFLTLRLEKINSKFSLVSNSILPVASASATCLRLFKFEGNNLELTLEMTLQHERRLQDSNGGDFLFVGSLLPDLRPNLEAKSPFFSDAVLVCQGQEFRCHKIFLAARYGLKSPLHEWFEVAMTAKCSIKV